MLVKVLKQMGLHGLLLVRCLVVNVSGEKCWHLAVQQQLPLHLELLLQQLLLCCLLVPELKHLVVGIVLIQLKTCLDPPLPMEQLVMLTKGSDCSLC